MAGTAAAVAVGTAAAVTVEAVTQRTRGEYFYFYYGGTREICWSSRKLLIFRCFCSASIKKNTNNLPVTFLIEIF